MSLTQDQPPTAPPIPDENDAPASETTKSSKAGLQLVRRLHFYAGILIAPFLLVAALSGAAYAIAPSLEKVVYRAELHTASTGPAQSLAAQIAAAQRVVPDLALSAVRPANHSGETTRVLFNDPSLGESERATVFVDPVTTTTQGQLVTYGSAGALPMRAWLSQFHRHLHLGEPGRIYSELAASWLWVIALGGLVLWISHSRRARTPQRRKRLVTRLFTVDRKSRGRGRTLNWHGVTGIWIIVVLLFLSATGLTWSRFTGDNIAQMRSELQWTKPVISTELGTAASHSAMGGHSDHGGSAPASEDGHAIAAGNVGKVDQVLTTARDAGITDAVEIGIPSSADTAFTVAQTRQPWQFSLDSVSIDGNTQAIVDSVRFADWPFMAKMAEWTINLHMGFLFGITNQIVLFIVAIALVTIIIRGYRMWWQRRPKRGSRPVGRAPRRGALRDLPLPVVLAVIAVAVVVGIFIPLLGISLAAFLVIDMAIGAWQALRTAPSDKG